MGSDLKASGLDRVQVAYIMGHQATSSVDVYGNAKTARGGRSLPKPSADADLSKVRQDHSEPPAANEASIEAPAVPQTPAQIAAGKNNLGAGLEKNLKSISSFHNQETQQGQGFEPGR